MITDDGRSSASTNSAKTLDYTTMAQEALLALSNHTGEAGCSQMNVLLYILHTYSPTEDITSVFNRVKVALRFLTRMGVVKKFSVDAAGESDSDDEPAAIMSPEDCIVKEEISVISSTKVAKVKDGITENKVKKSKNHELNKITKPKAVKDKLKVKLNKQGKKCKKENEKPISLSKPKLLSPALSAVCEGNKTLPRQEVVRLLWRYVKTNNLQDPQQKTTILCDDKMKALSKKKKLDQTEMLKLLKTNLTDA